jgi:hypothetical protein
MYPIKIIREHCQSGWRKVIEASALVIDGELDKFRLRAVREDTRWFQLHNAPVLPVCSHYIPERQYVSILSKYGNNWHRAVGVVRKRRASVYHKGDDSS